MPHGSIGSWRRKSIEGMDATTCYWCDCTFGDPALPRCDATYDHVIPRANGGSSHVMNLVRACELCNNMRGTTPALEWAEIANQHIAPHRGDLIAMTQSLHAAGHGYERFAAIAATMVGRGTRPDDDLLDEVSIRHWSYEHVCNEFGASLKRLWQTHGVDWLDFSHALRKTVQVTQNHNQDSGPVAIGHDMTLRVEGRLGWCDGSTFALVNMVEWKSLRSMKDSPEAMAFRKRSLDAMFRFTLLRHRRDRLGVLSYRKGVGGRERDNPVLVFATSGAAALRVHQRVTDLFLKEAA